MATTIYPKNIFDRKKMFMDKKFGLFKSLVLRRMQYELFEKQKRKRVHNVIICGDGIHFSCHQDAIILYEYYYRTLDIWNRISIIVHNIRRDFRYIIKFNPKLFDKYLSIFGLCCPYVIDGNMCLKSVNQSKFLQNGSWEEICKYNKIYGNRIELNCCLCPFHKKDEIKRKSIITDSLYNFPVELCNIIFQYSLPYSFKLS